jgi:hypothetical protein
MAAKKKSAKITTVPKGKSFMHKPSEPNGETQHDCGGKIVQASGTFPTATGATVFMCTGCDWISPDGYVHNDSVVQKVPRPKPIKKQKGISDPVELRDAVRKEVRKRTAKLAKVRATMPKNSKKLTATQRGKLSRYGFSAVQIRDELRGV